MWSERTYLLCFLGMNAQSLFLATLRSLLFLRRSELLVVCFIAWYCRYAI